MGILKNNVIAYSVKNRTKDGLYISVENGEVLVDSPKNLPREKILDAIEAKKTWILEKLNVSNTPITCDIKSTKIFGEYYDINLKLKNIKLPELAVENNSVNISIPIKYKNADINDIVKRCINKMYVKIADDKMEEIMEKTRIKLGLAPEDYEISEIKNNLAKCDKENKIIINPEIVKYDMEIIEYIVLHEFCHLKYRTHSKKFYDLILQYMPNYKIYENMIFNFKY